MTDYVLVYIGGDMPDDMTEEQRNAVMGEWGAWYEKLGAAIKDGGKPFGASKHVGDGTAPHATGYTVITADSLEAAVAAVDGHPHLKYGGQVSVYETFDIM